MPHVFDLKTAIIGRGSVAADLLTVPTGKVVTQLDFLAFNEGNATTKMKLSLVVGSTTIIFFEEDVKGRKPLNPPPIIKQLYGAGAILKFDPGSQVVSYSLTYMEADAL